jgi:hypothetical protein
MPQKAQWLRRSNPMDVHNEKASDKTARRLARPAHSAVAQLRACRQTMIAKATIQLPDNLIKCERQRTAGRRPHLTATFRVRRCMLCAIPGSTSFPDEPTDRRVGWRRHHPVLRVQKVRIEAIWLVLEWAGPELGIGGEPPRGAVFSGSPP